MKPSSNESSISKEKKMTEYIFASIYIIVVWVASFIIFNDVIEAASFSAAILSGLAYARSASVYDEVKKKK